MDKPYFDILLDAILHSTYVIIVSGILYSLLFYAAFKTITSMEDEKENKKWLKFWVFYGMVSFLCTYLPNGTLVKSIICGILLLKFRDNIILNFTYDVILANLLQYSYVYMVVLLDAFVHILFVLVKKFHWIIAATLTVSDDDAQKSIDLYTKCRVRILGRTKQLYTEEMENISSLKAKKQNESNKALHTLVAENKEENKENEENKSINLTYGIDDEIQPTTSGDELRLRRSP